MATITNQQLNDYSIGITENITATFDVDIFPAVAGVEINSKQFPMTEATGYATDTKLLLHFDGVDAAVTTTDSSPLNHTFTFSGNAQLDTSQFKFGTASLQLDGSNSFINSPYSTSWDIANVTNSTVDAWIRPNTNYGTQEIICQGSSPASNYWGLRLTLVGGAMKLMFHLYLVGAEITMTGTTSVSLATWHHVAVCKVGSDWGIYLDGVQEGYYSNGTAYQFNKELVLGVTASAIPSFDFNGRIDEARITHYSAFDALPNVGLTDTITVPTSAHSVGSYSATISGYDIGACSTQTAKFYVARNSDGDVADAGSTLTVTDAAINKTTLLENIWKKIYDLVVANITDPASRGLAHNGKWIYTSFPDPEGSGFPNYPILLIDSPEFDGGDITMGSVRQLAITVPFEVYTTNMEQIDTVTSQIINMMDTYRSTLEGYGLYNYRFSGGNTNTEVRDKKKYHLKSFDLVFDWCGE